MSQQKAKNTSSLSLGTAHFKEANEQIRTLLETHDTIELHDVFAQRYLGCAMPEGKRLEIFGTPGNDMASYMDGGQIEVFGNAQDQVGNTMNAGNIVIHGRCGDAAGYAMRGGQIYIRDDCGWRVGIHMKQYENKTPTIVIGGDAGSFLGEYMAGGIIVLMGRAGEYLATGMHGGIIYLKKEYLETGVPEGLVLEELDEQDERTLAELLEKYDGYFAEELGSSVANTVGSFSKLVPASSRPYASMYTN